jgi:hypothetical protein
MLPSSREFLPTAYLPGVHDIAGWLGIEMSSTPLNLSILWAVVCCVFVWVFIWRTPLGLCDPRRRTVAEGGGLRRHLAAAGDPDLDVPVRRAGRRCRVQPDHRLSPPHAA